MGLPANISNSLVLVHLNGLKMSSQPKRGGRHCDYEAQDKFIRFFFRIEQCDFLSIVTLSLDGFSEFETDIPYQYEWGAWFDPHDPHDPGTGKMLRPPQPTVTQL